MFFFSGSEMESKWLTFRIALLFTMVQVVLLNNYYGGGIVSSLLTEPPKTIRTFKTSSTATYKSATKMLAITEDTSRYAF
jgi:hypothetical protein